MKMLKRAIGGAAAAGAAITSKYIDEQLAAQRAQMLSDLQLEGQKKLDAYTNDPTRREMLRGEATKDATATADATNAANLRGKRAEATDADLTAGLASREGILGKARTAVEIERATAMLPLEIKKAWAMADAQGKAGARYRQDPAKELEAKIAVVEKTLGRPMTEPEKLGLLGLAKGRDPELDTVTVKETVVDDKGNTSETTRKEVRRPSAGGAAAADPYAVPKRDVPGKKNTGPGATEPQAETKPAWRPDPDSPAGKRRAPYEAARATRDDARDDEALSQQNQAAVREAVAEDKAAQVLASGDKRLMYRFQSSPEFGDLSAATRSKVSAAVNGR